MEESRSAQERALLLGQAEQAHKQELRTALKNTVLKMQQPVHMKQDTALEMSKDSVVLDNIEGQSCLYDLAEKLSNPLAVNLIISNEALKDNDLPQQAGYLALGKVLEHTTLERDAVDVLLAEELCQPEAVNKYLVACQNIARLVKISKEKKIKISNLRIFY